MQDGKLVRTVDGIALTKATRSTMRLNDALESGPFGAGALEQEADATSSYWDAILDRTRRDFGRATTGRTPAEGPAEGPAADELPAPSAASALPPRCARLPSIAGSPVGTPGK